MKKFALLLATLVLALTLIVPTMAEELPVYTYGNNSATWGQDATGLAPFGYKYILKETGEIKDMTFAGTQNLWNQGMEMYQATSAEAYCFAGKDCLHPATNALPAVTFTATHSGTVTIKYVYYGNWATTELQIYKNAYKADAMLKSQTPHPENAETDFEITVDVVKGDVILFALECGETNANDQTPCWINEVAYTAVTADPAPDTADTLSVVVALGTIALAGAVIVSKKH